MTTSSADRQALAVRFLNWMLNTNRQGEYSRSRNMLPSQRAALQTWENSDYIAFTRQLLDGGQLLLTDDEGGAFARAVQNALVAVISQESTAAEATADVVDRLNS
jgi:ABC-type glycerol-3-phosphate transport system substrate-binding protein